jgi:hypothetical protein
MARRLPFQSEASQRLRCLFNPYTGKWMVCEPKRHKPRRTRREGK